MNLVNFEASVYHWWLFFKQKRGGGHLSWVRALSELFASTPERINKYKFKSHFKITLLVWNGLKMLIAQKTMHLVNFEDSFYHKWHLLNNRMEERIQADSELIPSYFRAISELQRKKIYISSNFIFKWFYLSKMT